MQWTNRRTLPFFSVLLSAIVLAHCESVAAEGTSSISVRLDARRAVQGWLPVTESIPVSGGGPLTLEYSKWIPGEHSPSGPLPNLAGLRISVAGKQLSWKRDSIDLFAIHVEVPAEATQLNVEFVYLAANGGAYSSARTSTSNILSITWNKFVLLPKVDDYGRQIIAPSIVLPSPDWNYATALKTTTHNGAVIDFAPVTQEQLIDSPLDAGLNSRSWSLGDFNGAPVTLAVFADTPEQLNATPTTIADLKALVTQMKALYRYRHFGRYTFLLTVSDVMPGEGVEHHESSDNGTGGDFLTDRNSMVAEGDLLAHELNHSWNGKFRRPVGIATRNLQDPMIDNLLWVYEGMTQFYGDLQAERSGIFSKQLWLDGLALNYAQLDATAGRNTRPLLDTAVAASTLYDSPPAWQSERRAVDFYAEGELMWLEVDVLIRKLSHGHRSLDDVARTFFGVGRDSTAEVLTYSRADVLDALNKVQPNNWSSFFAKRVDDITPHPPDPFTPGGYKLVFRESPSAFAKVLATRRHGINARYSLGVTMTTTGVVRDVVPGMPAYEAGLGPGDQIIAVNDRQLVSGQSQMDDALKAAARGESLRFLVDGGNVYREVIIKYTGGPRYPYLERIVGTPDLLGDIARPLRTNGK